MNTPVKITAFVAALVASFGVAYGVGGSVTPLATTAEPAAHAGHRGSGSANGGGEHAEAGHDTPPGGLQSAQDGYTLDLKTRQIRAAEATELRFAIRDRAGRQITGYRREHGKELHLVLASRDLVTYRHLHPTRAGDGTWTIRTELPTAGAYRLFADFTPAAQGAKNLTLGADLAATGNYRPAPLPAPSTVAKVDDYTVALDGRLRAGEEGELTLKVSKNGRPVTDLQPYLGAYGHLVALRSGDLAYLHVHPNGAPGDGKTKSGPEVSFTALAPSPGTYRLFLDFRHEGKVRTAAFTVNAARTDGDGAGDGHAAADGASEEAHHHEDHQG